MSKKEEVVIPKRQSRKPKKLVYTYKKGKKVLVDKKDISLAPGPKVKSEGQKKS